MFCCRSSADNRSELALHRITHVLNAAHSRLRGGAETYQGMNITYLGIEGRDCCDYDMSANFQTAADFIYTALSGGGEREEGRGRERRGKGWYRS